MSMGRLVVDRRGRQRLRGIPIVGSDSNRYGPSNTLAKSEREAIGRAARSVLSRARTSKPVISWICLNQSDHLIDRQRVTQ